MFPRGRRINHEEVSVKSPKRILTVAALFSLCGCAAGQTGGRTPDAVGTDEIRLTVVNETDGPLEVFYVWESRSSRSRLGSVSVGRTADYNIPFVMGYLRVIGESPISTRTISSNALDVSEANRNDELVVTVNWRFEALLTVKE